MSRKFVDFAISSEVLNTFTSEIVYRVDPRCLTLPYFEEDKDSPCTECIVLACCTKKKCDKFEDWRKGRHCQVLIECWINFGISIFESMSNVESPIGYSRPSGIPIKFMFLFKLINRLLEYIINCKSWDTKKIHDFDVYEFDHRIKQLNIF